MTSAASSPPPTRLPQTEALAARLLQRAPVAGGVIAAQRADAILEMPFGTRGPHGALVTVADRFEIGSISKSIVALAAARLAAEGVWNLDDPVRGVLPWLRLPEGAGEPTLSHLLSHTSGWIAGNSASPGEVAQALSLPGTRVVTALGEHFHYSNIGYVVLGLAMQQATGRPLGELLTDAVLAPLGLPGALASITGAERNMLCPGTVPMRDDAPWSPGDPLSEQNWVEPAGADGNVAATARELLCFARALTAPAANAAKWLVDVVAQITTETAPGGEDVLAAGRHLNVEAARYGLGVNVERTSLGKLFTHGGGMIGYGAFFIAHPEQDLSVAVVLSGPGEWPYAELLARHAHAELIESQAAGAGDLRPGAADPIDQLRPQRAPLAWDTPEWSGLVGHYRSYTPWCPHYQVGVDRDGHLVLRAYSGVESPTADTRLVPLGTLGEFDEPWFRVGEDSRLPERARFGNVIDGSAQTLDIDGCVYSRVRER